MSWHSGILWSVECCGSQVTLLGCALGVVYGGVPKELAARVFETQEPAARKHSETEPCMKYR